MYPRQDVQALPFEVLKVAKSLPLQVAEATVKPTQGLLFHCVLGARCHSLGAGHSQEPGPGNSLVAQCCTSRPPSSRRPCRTLCSSQGTGKKSKIVKLCYSFT